MKFLKNLFNTKKNDIEIFIKDRGTLLVYIWGKKLKISGELMSIPKFYADAVSIKYWEPPYEHIKIAKNEKEKIINVIENENKKGGVQIIFEDKNYEPPNIRFQVKTPEAIKVFFYDKEIEINGKLINYESYIPQSKKKTKFIAYKDSIKKWEKPYDNKKIDEKTKKEIIEGVVNYAKETWADDKFQIIFE